MNELVKFMMDFFKDLLYSFDMSRLRLYLDYLKDKFFKKREPVSIDLEEVMVEIWKANFSSHDTCRFVEESGNGYVTKFDNLNGKDVFSIKALRKSLYAWSVNPFYRYKNCVVEAHFDFSFIDESGASVADNKMAGNCAAGVLFRYLNDGVFYSALVSDYGWVRLDAMFNGTPMPVLGWTKPVSEITGNVIKLKIIAVESKISLLVNDEWVVSVENDIIQASGKIAVAVQNWERLSQVNVGISEFSVVSEPLLVEAADSDATLLAKDNVMAHLNLAQTYFSMGHYVPAMLEIKKVRALREIQEDDCLLAGRIYFAERMFKESEEEFQNALRLNKDNDLAFLDLAGIYYHTDQFDKLTSLFDTVSVDKIRSSPSLSNLKGHLLHQQKEYELAAEYYHNAFENDPSTGIYEYHTGNELLLANKNSEALLAYIEAGKVFLKHEEYNDLGTVINHLERLDPDSEETLLLIGKFYYGIDDFDKAFECFEKLCEEIKTNDASAWYLYGLLLRDDDSDLALRSFEKAYELSPNEGLYCFRLAEAKFFNGDDCSQILEKAFLLDPENAWIHNLACLKAMDEDRLDDAEKEILIARKILPDEISLLANYIEVKRLKGELSTCISLFEVEKGCADLAVERNMAEAYHVIANALYDDELFDEADEWYNKAVKLNPNDPILLTNKAQNCLEIGLLNEADDVLVKALDIEPSVDIYRTLGHVAAEKGSFLRAIAALNEGLQVFNDDPDIMFDLVVLQYKFGDKVKAKALFGQLKKLEDSNRIKKLENEIV